MQNEAREEAEKIIQIAALIVKESTGIKPVLQIREGDIMKELKALIDEESMLNDGINLTKISPNNVILGSIFLDP